MMVCDHAQLPLTLYVHVPFCLSKCPYCDFRSMALASVPEQRYLKAVIRELTLRRQQLSHDRRPLHAIFFGGGTPSLFKAATIAGFLEQILALWPVSTTCEITLEANPESATLEKMRDWRQMGINRLSLGIQAFDPLRLQLLERPHDLPSARRAIRQARRVGFDNLNLDLIYATPGHTLQIWEKELQEAMAWEPQHLSCYALSIEPGTPFFQRSQTSSWNAVGETMETALFRQTWRMLPQGGWFPYEISNFARLLPQASSSSSLEGWANSASKLVCLHNRNYWSFGDYLGVGAAAHSKLSTVTKCEATRDAMIQVWRHVNPDTPEAYMTVVEAGGSPLQTVQTSSEEAGRECLLMGLRHDQGVRRTLYQCLTGKDLLSHQARNLALLAEAGLLSIDSQRVRLTEKGILLADAITVKLL